MHILKKLFPVYILTIVVLVLALNYYNTSSTGYAGDGSGQMSLNIIAPACGDTLCSYGEDSTCCIDCGCSDGYVCVENECFYGKVSSFSKPKFVIMPEEVEVALTLGSSRVLEYYVENQDVINIKVVLSPVRALDGVELGETEFFLEPGEKGEFEVQIDADTLGSGKYSYTLMGVSGTSTVYSHLSLIVVDLEATRVDLEVPVEVKFDLIWLVVPITISILFYLYYLKYMLKKPKRRSYLKF